MAFNDIEIEIKVKVSCEEFLEIKNKIKKIARFDKIVEQSDEYFDLANRSFLNFNYPYEWLSIRKRGNKNVLNYKKWYPENSPEFTHCDEFSTEVNDIDKLRKILLSLDLKSMIIVDKVRETYNYNDEFEIAFDSVKELGYFIEIEALKDLGGIEKTKTMILDFVKNLGIKDNQIVKRGYPYLLLEKKGMIK